jgi:hypothetical protein
LACCILILLWVQDEISYDRFHAKADDLYRAVTEYQKTKPATHYWPVCAPLAPALKEFSQKLQREILDSIDLLNKSSNDTYVFPPMKSVYEKIITDTKITLKIDLREYQKDDRMVFIKEYSEEPSDFGHIPYFCVLKIPKCFKFPKNVDVYEYLENKPEFIKYKKSLQRLLKNLDNYKFNMDEYGVIWVYHKK